jgi:hypothetical protein
MAQYLAMDAIESASDSGSERESEAKCNHVRYCRLGHCIERGYHPWTRRRLANLPCSVVFACDTCNMPFGEDDMSFACIECDFDMCRVCYYSDIQTEELLDFRPPSDEKTSVHRDDLKRAHRETGRYSRRRPRYAGRRVSKMDYPDPTTYGWKFTGSCEKGCAEFFEKKLNNSAGHINLNFYYTTGFIRTMIVHPIQGITPLFTPKENIMTPALYMSILTDPQVHTSSRHHKTLLL